MPTYCERAYLRELRRYVKALRKLLAITGPHEPPGFAEEIAAGDPWTEDEVFTYWDALIAALNAFPQDNHETPDRSGDVESWVGPAQLRLKNRGRLLASIRILLRVRDEWQFPIKEGGARGVWEIGTYEFDVPRVRFKGETDWRPIVAPAISREDHGKLTWACNAMEKLADSAEQDAREDRPAVGGDDADGERKTPVAPFLCTHAEALEAPDYSPRHVRETAMTVNLPALPPPVTIDGLRRLAGFLQNVLEVTLQR